MANVYTDFISGTLTSGINNSATSFSSAGLTNLAAVSGTDQAKIVLDPFGVAGNPEIVYVTGHVAGASSVTGLLRGQEGTTPRPHSSGVLFLHVPTAQDYRELRAGLAGITTAPGNTLATAAPVDLIAGGAVQVGSSTALSRSDHRHALAAGTPLPSLPGDVLDAGTATSVARSDHQHARETYSTTVTGVGASTAGSVATTSRGDHSHAIGTGAINALGMFSGMEPTAVVTSVTRPAVSAARRIYESDTKRFYESDGSGWLRRETLSTVDKQTGVTLTCSVNISNGVLTHVSSFTVSGSHDTDGFRRDGQYTRIPVGLTGIYSILWKAEVNDGSVPSDLRAELQLYNGIAGIGVSERYSAVNGGRVSRAGDTMVRHLVANQDLYVDVYQLAGSTKQLNLTLQLFLLVATS